MWLLWFSGWSCHKGKDSEDVYVPENFLPQSYVCATTPESSGQFIEIYIHELSTFRIHLRFSRFCCIFAFYRLMRSSTATWFCKDGDPSYICDKGIINHHRKARFWKEMAFIGIRLAFTKVATVCMSNKVWLARRKMVYFEESLEIQRSDLLVYFNGSDEIAQFRHIRRWCTKCRGLRKWKLARDFKCSLQNWWKIASSLRTSMKIADIEETLKHVKIRSQLRFHFKEVEFLVPMFRFTMF